MTTFSYKKHGKTYYTLRKYANEIAENVHGKVKFDPSEMAYFITKK